MAKILMKGNEAFGRAAIEAGCHYFFGYPITPQSELPEYLSRELPKVGGAFVQAESEVAAINMVYGAGGSGVRVMTSSSSPGVALKQEGITYCAGAEVPCVVLNIMRGGPGLGTIQPSQSDYYMSTKGGGNGDYRTPVDFEKERKQRNLPAKDWASCGHQNKRKPNVINSLYLQSEELEKHNIKLEKKYKEIEENEVQYEMYKTEDADLVFVAYGTVSRIVKTTIESMRKEGYKVGLIRPKTLWPYPNEAFKKIPNAKNLLVVEMSLGQMIDDVKLACECKLPVHFYGRSGGMIPVPSDIAQKAKEIMGEVALGGAK